MELFTEWKRSRVARKRISAKNLYYGFVGIFQSDFYGNDYIVYDVKYIIARKCECGDKIVYKDVIMKNKLYNSTEDLSLPAGTKVFHIEDSLDEYLLPNELYLGEVSYGRLLDLYFELNEEIDYEKKYNIARVLEFKKKN